MSSNVSHDECHVYGCLCVSIFNNPTTFHSINAAPVPDKAAILLLFLLGLGFQEATAQQRGSSVGAAGGRRRIMPKWDLLKVISANIYVRTTDMPRS